MKFIELISVFISNIVIYVLACFNVQATDTKRIVYSHKFYSRNKGDHSQQIDSCSTAGSMLHPFYIYTDYLNLSNERLKLPY